MGNRNGWYPCDKLGHMPGVGEGDGKWTVEEPAAHAIRNSSSFLRAGNVKSSKKKSPGWRKPPGPRSLCLLPWRENCSVAVLWCMVETMAGLERYRQGPGQVMVRHSLSGAQLSEIYWKGWECWQAHKQHCPPSWCPLFPSSQKENGSSTKWAKNVLICQPRAWKDREGEKRNTFSHDSQEWPGLTWL